MALGPQTVVVNGQQFAVPSQTAYFPFNIGTTRPSANVVSAPYNVPPSVAPPGVAPAVSAPSGVAAKPANPWSFTSSPVIMAIIFLIIGLGGLHLIHWHKG